MKDIDDLLPRVLEKAAACPEPTALRHIRDAAIEFCRRTRIWRESDGFILGDEECEAIGADPGAIIFEISHAKFDDTDLEAVTIDWLDKNEKGWRDQEGPPRWVTQSAPNTVRVVPKPDTEGTLHLELILLPSNDADQLPEILVDAYAKEIADGALGTILMLPAEFGNAQLASVHAALFNQAIGRWGSQVPRGQQRARRRVKAHF